ncbi:MAG: energy-coupling factor transporter transmembrane component T [Candidatus Bathyarchaeia archaeon]
MPLVEYMPGNSFLHRMHPVTKLVLLVCMTVLIFSSTNLAYQTLLLSVVIVLWAVVKIPFRYLKTLFTFAFFIIIFFMLTQSWTYAGNKTVMFCIQIPRATPLIGGATTTFFLEGILFGISMSIRLVALLMLMPLIVFTTPLTSLILGLLQLKLPYNYAFIATTALRFLPLLTNTRDLIIDAQKLRGLELEKVSFIKKFTAQIPLLVPLIVTSLKLCDDLETAIESRAFSGSSKRTYLHELKIEYKDKVLSYSLFTITIIGVLIGLFFLPTLWWGIVPKGYKW